MALGEGAIMAGPMGARPLPLDGGEWTPVVMTHRGANWLRKKESLTPRKLINDVFRTAGRKLPELNAAHAAEVPESGQGKKHSVVAIPAPLFGDN